MSDELYMKKEAARMSLVSALEEYKEAAETYGEDDDAMADELHQAISDGGFDFIVEIAT